MHHQHPRLLAAVLISALSLPLHSQSAHSPSALPEASRYQPGPTFLASWRDCSSVPFAARAGDDGFDVVWLEYGLPRGRAFDANLAATDPGTGSNVSVGGQVGWTDPEHVEIAPDGDGRLAAVWIEAADDPPTAHAVRLPGTGVPILLGEPPQVQVGESRSHVEPLGDGRLLIWFEFHDRAFVLDADDSVQSIDLGSVGRLAQLAIDPDDERLLAAWVEDLPTSPPSFRLVVERRTLAGTLVERVFEEFFLGAPSQLRLAAPRHGGALIAWNLGSEIYLQEVGGAVAQGFAPVDGGIVEHLTLVHDEEGNALVSWIQGNRLVVQRRTADGDLAGPDLFEPVAQDGGFLPPQPVVLPAGRAVIVANEAVPFILGAPPPCGGDSSGLYALETSLAVPTDLLLQGGRFRVHVDWQAAAAGTSGRGRAVIGTEQSGSFTFFDDDNKEIEIKILDGRAINGRFWVFAAGLSDVAYQIHVTDQRTGEARVYENPAGGNGNFIDTAAFD